MAQEVKTGKGRGLMQRVADALGQGSPYTRDCMRRIGAAKKALGEVGAGSVPIHPALPIGDPSWDAGAAVIGAPGSGKTVVLSSIADSIMAAGRPLAIIDVTGAYAERLGGLDGVETIGIGETADLSQLNNIYERIVLAAMGGLRAVILRPDSLDDLKCLREIIGCGMLEDMGPNAFVIVDGGEALGHGCVSKLLGKHKTAFSLQPAAAMDSQWRAVLSGMKAKGGSVLACRLGRGGHKKEDEILSSALGIDMAFHGKAFGGRQVKTLAALSGSADGFLWQGVIEWPFPGGAATPRPSRPEKEERLRDGAITVGLTMDERRALEAAAELAGVSPSALARQAIAALLSGKAR